MAYTTIKKPSDYFNTVLYTGDGTNSRAVTGVGFQPDFSWLKNRTGATAYHHQTFDSVRGARGLSQIRREQIESPLAENIISSSAPRGSIFQVYYENELFKFNVKKPIKNIASK